MDGGNHSDLWLARVNIDGDPVWQLERDHRFDDQGTGVAIAPEGGLISLGNSDSGPLDRIGIVQALAVGPSGDAYLAGVLDAPPPEPGEDNVDIWIARVGGG